MNKNHSMIFIFLILFIHILFYSCENREDQTSSLSESWDPAEYPKIEMKLGGKTHKVSLNYKVNKQTKTDRKFVEISTTHLFKIGSMEDSTFYYTTLAKSDSLGNIYILDMADCSVKKFDSKGVFIRKYGRKGKGPGEFISPFRIDILDNSKLLVLDPNQKKCEIFDGNETKQFKLTSMPTSVCFVDSMFFVTLQMINPFDYSAIIRYNILNNESIECQNLILNNSDEFLGPLAFLKGDILGIDKEGFLYVPKYMNHFVKYSTDGKIIYARNTIEDIKLPSINNDNSQMTSFMLPEEHNSSWRAFIVNDKLYNVSHQAREKKNTGTDYVIDAFYLSNGDYVYSFVLPNLEGLKNIYMDKERLYLLKIKEELEVLSYKIDE